MSAEVTRRDAMKILGATAVLGGISIPNRSFAQSAPPAATASPRRRVIRVAHLTDVHVQPERHADKGLVSCLHHVQDLKDKPQIILTGGDHVYDSFESNDARTQLQWDIWKESLANECSIPVKSCIGNHDCWGWHKEHSKTTGNEVNYGKKRALEMLHLDQSYSSFDLPAADAQSHWHCIFIDSIQHDPNDPNSYRAFIDDEQFDWLERDLKATATDTPVIIVSHVPIMSIANVLYGGRTKQGDFSVSGARNHQDMVRIKDLFAKHPNIKVCLSGHLHLVDRVDYNGVTYLCDGAVSGNWWKGRHKECDEGYAVIDLYDDGSFERQYITYGWQAQE